MQRWSRIARIGLHTAAVCAVLAGIGWIAPAVADRPPPVHVTVDGTGRQLVAGSTLADAVRDLRLRPRPGDLVDVTGVTLRTGVYPGRVLVDGAAAPRRSGCATATGCGSRPARIAPSPSPCAACPSPAGCPPTRSTSSAACRAST